MTGNVPDNVAARTYTMSNDSPIYPSRFADAFLLAHLQSEQVAALTGIAQADIELFLSGLSTPTDAQIDAIASVTGFPRQWFRKPPVVGWEIAETSLRFH